MITALLLIFDSAATWDRIAQARRSLPYVLLAHLLPLLVVPAAFEGFGLHRWGKWQGTVAHIREFSSGEVLIFEVIQILLTLLVIFLGAKLVQSLGETFHGRHAYRQAFTVLAYGLSPVLLLRFLNGFRPVSPWVCWGVGILLCIAILYHGVPRVMEPDPPHAFGLYLMTAILAVLITGLVRFLTAWYLAGRLTKIEPIIYNLGSWLHL